MQFNTFDCNTNFRKIIISIKLQAQNYIEKCWLYSFKK